MAEAGLELGSQPHGPRPLALCTWRAQELDGSRLLPPPGHRETFSRTGKGGCSFPSFSMVPSVFQTVICGILRSPGLPVARPPPDPLRLVGDGCGAGALCSHTLGTRAQSAECACGHVRPSPICWYTHLHRGSRCCQAPGSREVDGKLGRPGSLWVLEQLEGPPLCS